MSYNPLVQKRQSTRLKGFDYGSEALYFITICSNDRIHLFGEIAEGEMNLNDCGKIALKCWMEIPQHFPHTRLHEFIIMPDHIHGIIEIVENMGSGFVEEKNIGGGFVGAKNMDSGFVGAKNISPQQNPTAFKSPEKTIGSIVRGFKIGVTQWLRNEFPDAFTKNRVVWQRNYYDRIIRDTNESKRITKYIRENPQNWNKDKFHQ